ncbi:MAG: E3 binding domain-containing protein, partial [Gammaproteobacteria bacterium]
MEVKVPQLPESVTDATLVTWHRKVGEPIRRDENLVDLETDKVVLEVPAPANGVLTEIKQADGATVTSGEVLALFEPQELSAESEPAPAAESGAEPAAGTGAEPAAETGTESPAESAAATEGSAASAPEPSASTGEVAAEAGEAGRPEAGGAPRMGPAARKLVDQHDLDASHIAGTGRDGMLTKGDVLSYLATHSATNVGMEEAESDAEVTEPEAGPPAGQRREVRVGMTRLRQRIAERLVE